MVNLDSTIIAAVVVTLTSHILLLTRDWRISILILAAQYVGVFFLVSTSWPVSVSAIVLISGWISCIVLAMAIINVPELSQAEDSINLVAGKGPRTRLVRVLRLVSERAFYILAAFLVLVVIGSQISQLVHIIPGIHTQQAWGGMVLIGLGLLITGFSVKPLQISIGLMTWLSGFEILYAVVQTSLLMAGLLAGVNLALAMAGAYFLLAVTMEPQV